MKRLGVPIERLFLPSRCYNALLKNGIGTVEQVRKLKAPCSLKGIGRRGAEEIAKALAAFYSTLPQT